MLAFSRPPPLSTGAHPLTTLFVGRGTIDIADPLLGPPPCNRPPADAATKDSVVGQFAVAALYERRRVRGINTGGHRPPLQKLKLTHYEGFQVLYYASKGVLQS